VFHRQPAARVPPAAQRPVSVGPGPKAREVFRLAPPLVLWWVWLAFAAANIADFAVQGASARFVTVVCAILATVTGIAYALALRPRVIAEPAGLVIVNPFRDHHVPWGAIQTVDTGDWVRVHYASDTNAPSSAAGKSISCWALYISARVKRKAAIPPRMKGGSPLGFSLRSRRGSRPGGLDEQPGYATDSRLPEEARYLASLPVAKAIAARLDTRAAKERARGSSAGPVTARWAWFPLAAVAVPALALLIMALI
jgi:Bacterial PH domain